ncbi:MAG: efflux RND transporter permease subunit, partial [Spirochaetia bacterium]|nr:efflux RND transporter permease subunit [Spirochaetia bacterium]
IFEDGTDIYQARQFVNERLQTLRDRLPSGITPEMGPVSTGLGEIVMYVVSAKAGSKLAAAPEEEKLRSLRLIQERTIRPALKRVPGVADVDTNGGYQKIVAVQVDPVRLEQVGLPLMRLEDSLRGVGGNYGGGFVEPGKDRVIVRARGRFESIEELRSLPLRPFALGGYIPLSSVARVGEGSEPRLGAATFGGEETVLGIVMMRVGGNSREAAALSVEALRSLDLPGDVEVEVLYSRSRLVDATIRTVLKNLAEGAVFVVIVLFVILGNMRAALLVALAIPMSMLVALLGMKILGISANLMSLGAVDFGLMVDASVVVIENLLRRMEGLPPILGLKARARFVRESVKEVAPAVISGLLIIMAVYVPILTLGGVEGKMFRPMAVVVLLALSASLVTALLLVPAMALTIMPVVHTAAGTWFKNVVESRYTAVLEFTLRKRALTYIGTVVFAAVSLALFLRLDSSFVPQLDEGDLVIGIVRRADISLTEMVQAQKRAEKIILSFPEVEHVFSRMGTPQSAMDPMPVNFADTFVILKKDGWPERKNGPKNKEQLFAAIRAALDAQDPGQQYSPTQPIEMRFNEMLEGSRADVALRLYADDLDGLYKLSSAVLGQVKQLDDVGEAGMDEIMALRRTPLIDFRIDPARLAEAGIGVDEARAAFETAMSGREVGYFYQGDRRFPILLILGDAFRKNPGSVERVLVERPGGMGALGDVMRPVRQTQITTIGRLNGKRYASISIYLKGTDVAGFVKKADAVVKKVVGGSAKIEWAGQYRKLESARKRLLLVIPVLLGVIALILYESFKSVRQTFLVLLVIPFAMTGGAVALALRGIPFSIPAAIGFIALAGIAVLNGTVLVTFLNELKHQGTAIRQVVLAGGVSRLRPVLITALVASIGFVPMAFNTGTGAEVQRPLATVVIGGIMTSTALTLLLFPSLYELIERGRRRRDD